MSTTQPMPAVQGLDEVITQTLTALKNLTPGTDEYTKGVDQLTKLYAARDSLKEKPRWSLDALVPAFVNLLGIGMILGHERAHVVTSKALSFVPKLKV